MVNGIIKALRKEVGGLHEAAFLLAFFALASQVLALFRDRMLAHEFGAGATLDVYYAAFRIPDFIYISIASFVSLTVLIPFLSRFLTGAEASRERAKEFLDDIFSVFMLIIVSVCAAAFLAMPYAAKLIAPGFGETELADLTSLSRLLLLSPIILGISNLFGSVTQVFNRFFVYAMAPVLYNAGIIFGVIFFYPTFGLSGLGLGVILGAALHAGIQLPAVIQSGLTPRFRFLRDFSSIKSVITLSLPRTVTLSASHFSLIVIVALASTVYNGSISVFNFAFNLQSVPLSIIGVSYSLAAFPTLAGFFSRGEKDRFSEHMVSALRHIIFWSLPITALFVVLRAQIVRVILGSGFFSWSDTKLTAAALALFSVSIAAQGAVLLLVRGFYAAGETKVPLLVNVSSSALTVALSFVFLFAFKNIAFFKHFTESLLRVDGINGTAILMLPLAYSFGSIVNALLLWSFFRKKYLAGSPRILREVFLQSSAAAIFIGFVSYNFLNVFDNIFNINTFWGIFLQGALSGLFGIIAGAALLHLLKNKELSDIFKALKHRFWKSEVIAPEPTQL